MDKTWAIILGGSSGLGLASALELAKQGFHIFIVHRDRKSNMAPLQESIKVMREMGVEVRTLNKDALKTETIAEVISMLPKRSVKVLLHSIAKGTVKPMQELSIDDFRITLDAMALSWWEWTSALIAAEAFAEGAQNLAFTSEGNNRVWKGYGAVSVAKAALEAIMRQMAVEYGPLGIRTNCIQAGATDTPSLRHIPNYEVLLKHAEKRNPLGHVTTPEAVGKVVAMLCSKDSNWVNGTIIKADGGESLC
ncbi:MAG: SDR family oxidoreductase [Aureisphaera sp.]